MNSAVDQDALFRATHVGGSEVSALFDCNPWLSHFELYHRKKGTIATPEFNAIKDDGTPEAERIYWGVRLESAIIDAAKERYGYEDRNPAGDLPALSNGKGLGGHPDRRVTCPQRGKILLEVKMADWLVRKGWGDEPPLNYLLQGTTYAGLDQCDGFDLLVLVGGNKLERFQYDFRPKLYAEIERRVESFWESVHANRPPKADYSRDLDTIRELYSDASDTTIDLRGDNLAITAAAEYQLASDEAKAAQKRADAAKAELLEKLGHHTTGMMDGFIVKATAVAPNPGTEVTDEMVGTFINARKGYRLFSVKEAR